MSASLGRVSLGEVQFASRLKNNETGCIAKRTPRVISAWPIFVGFQYFFASSASPRDGAVERPAIKDARRPTLAKHSLSGLCFLPSCNFMFQATAFSRAAVDGAKPIRCSGRLQSRKETLSQVLGCPFCKKGIQSYLKYSEETSFW